MADSTQALVATNAGESPRRPDRAAPSTFSGRDKLRIVEAAERCSQLSELGLLLRPGGPALPAPLLAEAIEQAPVPAGAV